MALIRAPEDEEEAADEPDLPDIAAREEPFMPPDAELAAVEAPELTCGP